MKVKLIYFKASGKYYSEGEYETQHKHMWKIFAEVRQMHRDGRRGLRVIPGVARRDAAGAGRFHASRSQNAGGAACSRISSTIRSRGMTPQRAAQASYCAAISATRSGCRAARSLSSVRSASMS